MKKLIILGICLFSLLFATVGSSTSQEEALITAMQKTVHCGSAKPIFKELVEGEYNEKPFWTGNDAEGSYVLMVNEKSKSWTLVQFDDTVACILGVGDNHRRVYSGPLI